MIVTEDRFIRNLDRVIQQLLSPSDLIPCVSDRLRIRKVQRTWERNRQAVAQAILGKWQTIAVADQPARRGHIEIISSGEFLGFERWDNRFLFSGGCVRARGSGWNLGGSCSVRRRLRERGPRQHQY